MDLRTDDCSGCCPHGRLEGTSEVVINDEAIVDAEDGDVLVGENPEDPFCYPAMVIIQLLDRNVNANDGVDDVQSVSVNATNEDVNQ